MRIKNWARHIPNALTILRIVLTIVFIWFCIRKEYVTALCFVGVAFISDILDGYLARKFNWVSNLGKLLDPIADKFLTVSALFCLWYAKQKAIFMVLFVAILIKELTLIIGAVVKLKEKIVVHSDFFGKLATAFMCAGVVVSLLSLVLPVFDIPGMVLLLIGTVAEFVALIHYGNVYLWGPDKEKAS